MIDAERLIFAAVEKVVRAAYPDAFVTGEYVNAPAAFPCVSLVEIGNAVYRKTSTGTRAENHAAVAYEINVYSNRSTGKKSECRAIMALADGKLPALAFTRTMLEPIPNIQHAAIYRLLGRYRAVIGRDYTIYRR